MELGALVNAGAARNAGHAAPPATAMPARRLWPLPALGAWALAWALFIGLRRLGIDEALAVLAGTLVGRRARPLRRHAHAAPDRRRRLSAVAAGERHRDEPAGPRLADRALAARPRLPVRGLARRALLPDAGARARPARPACAAATVRARARCRLRPRPRPRRAAAHLSAGPARRHRAQPAARLAGALALPGGRPARAGAAAATCGAPTGPATPWSICSSARKACRARWPRPSRSWRAGAWLASLEFEATALVPQAVLHGGDGRPVWLYRMPFVRRDGAEES